VPVGQAGADVDALVDQPEGRIHVTVEDGEAAVHA
jgi:hypothetical protein